MTALDAVAMTEARVAIDSARRRHEREAMVEYRQGHIIRAARHAQTARQLARFGPGELVVVKEIG